MKQCYSYNSVLKTVCILAIALGFSSIGAQNKNVADSIYFISYPDKIVVKANVDTQTDTYILRERATGERLEIMPNNQLRLFF